MSESLDISCPVGMSDNGSNSTGDGGGVEDR